MQLPIRLSSVFHAGACCAALAAGSGCGATAQPAAQSAGAATPAEPSATAPVAPSSPQPEPRSGSHLTEFVGIGRGDRIADLGPGRGYSIAPFAGAVGPFGAVYVRHDARALQAPPSQQGAEAAESAVPNNVIRMDTPLDAPFAPEAKNLNCVTFLFTYHDLIAERRDRRGFNAAVFHALVPGGCYVVAEHAARLEAGSQVAQDPNRVDASVVRAEVEAVGFRFVEAADFLLPEKSGASRGEASQYVLKFQKPRPR